MAADDIRAMSDALAADPSSLVFLPLGEALLARGEYSHASRVAQRGAARHAGRADAHDLVARIALAQGDEARADEAWTTVLGIAPGFGTAHRGLGFLRYRQGRLEEARAHLEAALAEDATDASVLSALDAVAAAEAAADAAADAAAEAAPAAAEATRAPRITYAGIDPPPPRRPTHAGADAPPPMPASSAADAAATLFDALLGDSAQVALLLESDGVVAAGRYETADGTDLGALLGAHLSGVSDEAQRAMRHFDLGAWTRITMETDAAIIAMAPVGEPVVLVAAPQEMPLGFVRRTLERCAATARAWLGGGA